MNKNINNLKQLLYRGYTLSDAMSLCSYRPNEKKRLEIELKDMLMQLKYKNKDTNLETTDDKISITII